MDTAGYCQVVCKGATLVAPTSYVNPTYVILPPQGGFLGQSFNVGTQAATQYSTAFGWTIQSCDLNGNTATGTATNVLIYLAGL